MIKLYLIVTTDAIDRKKLIGCIEALPGYRSWFYSIPNSLFVHFNGTAEDLSDAIEGRFGNDNRFFVSEVPLRNAQGWIPRAHWDIIRQNQVVHEYQLGFDGYWLSGKEDLLPDDSGVYCVYAARHGQIKNSVVLTRLLYIGQAENVRVRHRDHELKSFWLRQLQEGECVCYSVANVPRQRLDICEAALIYWLKPICNTMGKKSFSHAATRIVTTGANALIPGSILITP